MSCEGKLGPKKIRRAEGIIGHPLTKGFAHSPDRWDLVLTDGRRVAFNPRSNAWSWLQHQPFHFSSGPSDGHWVLDPSPQSP